MNAQYCDAQLLVFGTDEASAESGGFPVTFVDVFLIIYLSAMQPSSL